MVTVKLKFRPSSVVGQAGTLYYQITSERRVRRLSTPYKILPSEWDDNHAVLSFSHIAAERADELVVIRRRIHSDIERFAKIRRRFEAEGLPLSADQLSDEFLRHETTFTLERFMQTTISSLLNKGARRTAETYLAALRSFRHFLDDGGARTAAMLTGETDLLLDNLSPAIIEAYETWLRRRGLTPNSISFYMRILRAAYNRAVSSGAISDRSPFKHVYTGVDKTVKRALPLRVISRIKNLDLSPSTRLDYARDMFMLSFYFRGMSFIDMAFLKKSDLRNGSIVYCRRKTGQRLVIGWTSEMQSLIDKYPTDGSAYLLPILKGGESDPVAAYRRMSAIVNYNLKRVAGQINLDFPLTMYVARHSWASAAKAKGVPISVISEGMGHDSEATTQIYLASLDTSAVDEANSLILSSLD